MLLQSTRLHKLSLKKRLKLTCYKWMFQGEDFCDKIRLHIRHPFSSSEKQKNLKNANSLSLDHGEADESRVVSGPKPIYGTKTKKRIKFSSENNFHGQRFDAYRKYNDESKNIDNRPPSARTISSDEALSHQTKMRLSKSSRRKRSSLTRSQNVSGSSAQFYDRNLNYDVPGDGRNFDDIKLEEEESEFYEDDLTFDESEGDPQLHSQSQSLPKKLKINSPKSTTEFTSYTKQDAVCQTDAVALPLQDRLFLGAPNRKLKTPRPAMANNNYLEFFDIVKSKLIEAVNKARAPRNRALKPSKTIRLGVKFKKPRLSAIRNGYFSSSRTEANTPHLEQFSTPPTEVFNTERVGKFLQNFFERFAIPQNPSPPQETYRHGQHQRDLQRTHVNSQTPTAYSNYYSSNNKTFATGERYMSHDYDTTRLKASFGSVPSSSEDFVPTSHPLEFSTSNYNFDYSKIVGNSPMKSQLSLKYAHLLSN